MKNFDSFLDEVRENAKAAAAAVTQTAAMIYDASKHKISAETIKRAIGKKLIELGKVTYKSTTQDLDLAEDIAKIVEEITELKQNLAIVNAHIASIKNQKICPDCENHVTKESQFCNVCGHKFEPEQEPAQTAEAAEETAEAADAPEAVQEAQEEAAAPQADDIVVAAKEAVEEISEDAEEAVKAADEAAQAE